MNLKKEIKTLVGGVVNKSFPSKDDIEKVKSEKKIEQVKTDDLPSDTVENVIMNCLTQYAVEDPKEVFDVQIAANFVLSEDPEKEFTDRIKNFLVKKVLPQATIRNEKDENGKTTTKGVYTSWVIVQVLAELGVTE
jgi:hypothetical protein